MLSMIKTNPNDHYRQSRYRYLGHPISHFFNPSVTRKSYHVDFHSVASTQNGSLFDMIQTTELAYSSWPLSLRNSKFLPHFNRRRVDAETNHYNAASFFCVSCKKIQQYDFKKIPVS